MTILLPAPATDLARRRGIDDCVNWIAVLAGTARVER